MCWTGKSIKQIASEDIPCFKICRTCGPKNDSVRSIYMDKRYTLGETYMLEESFQPYMQDTSKDPVELVVNVGFHSYHPSVEAVMLKMKNINHLYLKGGTAPDQDKQYLDGFDLNFWTIHKVECIIPKGSAYYLNDRGEYVSDAIKPIRISKSYYP